MTSIATEPCQLKRGFFRCGLDKAGFCQYCGRSFCLRHGVVQADGQEICSRRFCVAKRDDLVIHLAYKTAVAERNTSRRCGLHQCELALAGQCIRCMGFFCDRHVTGRDETILENQVRVQRMASLCHHCWERRPIWLRM